MRSLELKKEERNKRRRRERKNLTDFSNRTRSRIVSRIDPTRSRCDDRYVTPSREPSRSARFIRRSAARRGNKLSRVPRRDKFYSRAKELGYSGLLTRSADPAVGERRHSQAGAGRGERKLFCSRALSARVGKKFRTLLPACCGRGRNPARYIPSNSD